MIKGAAESLSEISRISQTSLKDIPLPPPTKRTLNTSLHAENTHLSKKDFSLKILQAPTKVRMCGIKFVSHLVHC